jgi:hypothetical protein
MSGSFTLTGKVMRHDKVTPAVGAPIVIVATPYPDLADKVIYSQGATATTDGTGAFTVNLLTETNLEYAVYSYLLEPNPTIVPAQTAGSTHDLTEFGSTPGAITPTVLTQALAARDAAAASAAIAASTFDPLHPTYGAVGDGTTDDTTAVLAAVAAARAANGYVLLRKMFLINSTVVQDSSFGIIALGGKAGLRPGASMPASAPLLWTKVTGSTPSSAITQGHLYGWTVHDLRMEGNSRTVACKGWVCDLVTAGNVRNVDIRHFAQEGFLGGTSDRETDLGEIHVRGCGDFAGGYPQVSLAQSTSADAHNNLTFKGLKSIYPFGVGVSIVCTDDTSPTRSITLVDPMVHGFTPGTPVTDEGETLTPDWRCVAAPLMQIADAQAVTIITPRLHRSGYGQPHILIRKNPNTASTKNTVTIIDPRFGLAQHQTGTFTAVAATDVCTLTGGQLGTGALIRFTTTGTLPAGLALLTDYYAIRVTDNTFKVATSLANAEAGTAVDITDTGTGTHTVSTQDCFVRVEGGASTTNDVTILGGRATDDVTNTRCAVMNKSADFAVQMTNFSGASAPPILFEPFSASDSPNRVIGSTGNLMALPTRVVKKLAESRLNNTTVVDAELLLTLTPGTWKIQGWLEVDGSTTGDLNVQWFSSQAGWTGGIQFEGQATSATVNVGSQFNQVSGRGATVGRGMIGVGTLLGIPFYGSIVVDVTGQFQIRWAQNTTDAANATTVNPGSLVEGVQVA